MNAKQISDLFERLGRFFAAIKEKAGTETSWTYTFPDGQTHRYVVRGVKSHVEMEDDIVILIGWIWNTKDYLTQWAKANGKNYRQLHAEMVNHPDISVCGELANASKHGVDKKYHVGAMTFSVPDGSMKRITFLDRQVEADVQNSETVEYRLPVLDRSENNVGDAFEYAARAIAALEHFRLKIEEP